MGKIPTQFTMDTIQALNIALHERKSALVEDLFIHQTQVGTYQVRNLEEVVASFSLAPLPGCCGVMVSYYSVVAEKFRSKGLGKQLLAVRMSACRNMGYGLMVATVLQDNRTEQKLLTDAGWIQTGEFRNPKTSRIVLSYSANL